MFFAILWADLKELNHILIKANKNGLCQEVLCWHKIWHKKVKQDTKALETSCHINDARVKELMSQEISNIQKIQERLQPSWTDKVGDFFGNKTSEKRFQVRSKFNNLAILLQYAVDHYDDLKKKFSNNLPHEYSGYLLNNQEYDPHLTHEGFCYRLILIFQNFATSMTAGNSLTLNADSSSILYEFDTLGFDCSGSILSRENTFIMPHQGYIFSGQRGPLKHRFGPRDCTGVLSEFYPELPEMGFTTSIVWAWQKDNWENFKAYEYMKPILEKVFSKTDGFEPGNLLFIKGHVWIILGKKGKSLYVINYTRADLKTNPEDPSINMNGFAIKEIAWPSCDEKYKEYFILKPKF